MRIVPAVLCVATLSLACSQPSTGPGDGDHNDDLGIALDALDAQLVHAYCATLFAPEGNEPSACCEQADLDLVFQQFESKPANLEECVALISKHASVADTIKKSVDNGRARYDGEQAAACISAMLARPCDVIAAEIHNRVFDAPGYLALASVPRFCEVEQHPVLTATATAQTGCTEDYECSSGNFCNRPPLECKVVNDADRQDVECDGTAADRNGICRRPNGQFAPRVCCEGVVVDCSGAAPDGKCEPLPTEGQSCNGPCASGLTCDGFALESTCIKKLADGEECFFPGECETTCVKTELNGTGTCGTDIPVCGGPSVEECQQAETEIRAFRDGECLSVIEQDPPIDGCEKFLPIVGACCGSHEDQFGFCF